MGELYQKPAIQSTRVSVLRHVNSWAYAMHAAALWKTTRDRARTLSLLCEAPTRENRDMTYFFVTLAQLEDVREDPEFLAAVQRPG